MKICPTGYLKKFQIDFKILPKKWVTLKLPKTLGKNLSKWWNLAKSGHTGFDAALH